MQMKRILSLVLALGMVFALAAPAFAAADDGTAEPHVVTIPCDKCGEPAYRTSQTEKVVIWVSGCSSKPNKGHNHTIVNSYYLTSCSSCSWSLKGSPYHSYTLPC